MKHSGSIVLIFSFLPAICGLALAHSGATGIVKERMDLMKSIAGHMKTIGKMIKGESDYDADKVVVAARIIADHAEEVPDMFPEGSIEDPSKAVPEIWRDWEAFIELSADLGTHAIKLSNVADDAVDVSGIRQQFSAVGKTCSACHEDFRANQ